MIEVLANIPHTQFMERTLKKLPFDGARLLDVGCGTGRNSLLAAQLGFKVLGIDADVLAISQAESAAQQLPQEIRPEFLQADLVDFDFSTIERPDVVVADVVFQEIKEPAKSKLMDNLIGVTALGGVHVICDYIGHHEDARDNFELFDLYKPHGWRIVEYYEDEPRQGSHGLLSYTKIITCKD